MKSKNSDAYLNPKPQVPRTQNQALHEEAIALILQTKQKRSEASVFEKAKQTREEYNKRRTEATDKLRTVLTKIWEAFDCGESVGIFATRKAWCKDQKVTMRWCQKVIAGPQSKKANSDKSVRVDVGQQVIFRDGIYTVGLDGDGKAAFIPVALHVPIVHVNDQPYDLYIGRKHNRNGNSIPASIWGNHDHLPLHEFEKQVRSNPELMAKLPELKGKVLGCWHRIEDYSECHGSVLLKLVAELGDDQPPPIPAVKSCADGAVTVQANFYNEEEVKALFDDCAKLNFVRGKVRGKERRHAVRIFCDVEAAVRRKEARSPLSEAPNAVKKLLADLSKHSGKNINYAAVVEYRDGDDYIAPHQHNEDRGNDATVWIVSTGAERPFVVKPIDGGAATKFLATLGSLITLSSEANETHVHSVPKCKGCTGVRYSVNCKALPISITDSEVQEPIPSSPDRNDASSTSVASPAKSKPQKDAKTVKTNYEHKPSFLTEEEADDLYSTVMKQHSWVDNGDGSSQINYGYTYSRGGPAIGEIPDTPDFLQKLADKVSQFTKHPVNFVQVHRFQPEHPVLPHYDPRGMCVPMITVGQERTFQVGDDGNSKPPSGNQLNRKVEDHSPKTRILMRHGDLLVFIGNKVLHSMYPASKDEQFNPNGYDYRISILFRYATEAMREFGVGKCNRHGHEKHYRDAVRVFRARQASEVSDDETA